MTILAPVPKIPAVTIWFWLVKTMITAADVFWPDSLYRRFGQVLVTGVIVLAVAVTLAVQFRTRGFRAWAFWPATVAVSVAGTELANGVYDELRLPYAWISLGYLVVLAALLGWWRAREGTLALRDIDSPRRERFYWAAALVAFALGSAIGHAIIVPDGLLVWAVVVGGIAVGWKWLRFSAVLAFWSCYVLTRPLGTSAALALSSRLGQWPVSAGFAVAVLVFAAWAGPRPAGGLRSARRS